MIISPELLAKIRRLELRASHLASDLLLGEYASAYKGRGWEFDEVRSYQVGDDLRSIDWNVTARMGDPYVKVFREEREMTLMLLLDVSSSLFFGSARQQKHELAAELAAVLAFLAIRHQDKVGLLLFSDHVERYIPPSKGRAHVWNIIRSVLGHQAKGRGTDMEGALQFFLNVRRRRSLAFLLSDFWVSDDRRHLKQVAQRHELVCARILDPREGALPDVGAILLEDQESGRKVLVNTSDLQGSWQTQRQREGEEWQRAIRNLGATPLNVTTEIGSVDALHGFLRERDQRRRRR